MIVGLAGACEASSSTALIACVLSSSQTSWLSRFVPSACQYTLDPGEPPISAWLQAVSCCQIEQTVPLASLI